MSLGAPSDLPRSEVPMLGQDTGQFALDVLDAHNAYRKLHGSRPLKLNPELNAIAQEWADHLAETNSFKHSTSSYRGSKLGENIACKWGSGVQQCRGREVVHQWYSEEPQFVYGEDPHQMNAGHFSQVVWRGSEEVGVGCAVSASGKHITVCNYFPAGNMMGKFPDNVIRPDRR